jgi:hypothetical protein
VQQLRGAHTDVYTRDNACQVHGMQPKHASIAADMSDQRMHRNSQQIFS